MSVFYMARVPNGKKWVQLTACAFLIAGVLGMLAGLVPNQSMSAWVITTASGFVALMVAFYFFDRSAHVRFEVTDNALKIKGDVWRKTFPLASLDLAGASIIDLAERKEYQPRWKLMGTGMPGYSSGYFSLRNGMKATVFLSEQSRVLCLPVTGGQRLLLSCVDPEGLLAALKNQYATIG